jgi:hypothetical protein
MPTKIIEQIVSNVAGSLFRLDVSFQQSQGAQFK